MQATLSKLLLMPYFVLIGMGLMIPSDGQHGILAPKSLSFVLSAFFFLVYVSLKQKVYFLHLRLLWFFFNLGAFLVFWLLVSLMNDDTTNIARFDQLKLFLVTAFVPLITLYLYEEELISPQQIFKVVIYASFIYALFKVTLVVLHLMHVIDIWKLLRVLGIRFMRMNIYGGLERVQTSVDIATPFLLFFLLQSQRLGLTFSSFFRQAYIFVSITSTFLSFSRYLIFVCGLSFLLYWMTLGLHKIVKIALVLCLLSVVFVCLIGPDTVYKVAERRLFSYDNFQSDQARTSQAETLLKEFHQVPFFGKGLGGYAPDEIRDAELLHSYEVQWVAFLMQLGLVGILILFIPILIIVYSLLKDGFSLVKASFVGIFGLWLLSGFTNPFLISLTSGIIYSLFLLAALTLNRMQKSKTVNFPEKVTNLLKPVN
jgi:hypothetical protein